LAAVRPNLAMASGALDVIGLLQEAGSYRAGVRGAFLSLASLGASGELAGAVGCALASGGAPDCGGATGTGEGGGGEASAGG